MTRGRIFRERISRADLARLAEEQFGDWIKAVLPPPSLFDPDVPPDSARGLSRYFFGFAWAARQLHYRRQSAGSAGSP